MTAPAPKTYRDLYTSFDARDCIPLLDAYGGDSNATQQTLNAGLTSSAYDEVAQVVVLLHDGKVRTLHRVTAFSPPFGTTTSWDGRVFGFCDDVGPGGAITLVEAPTNMFRKAQATNVLTMEATDAALLALAPNETHLPAIADGTANSESVTTRYSALAPFNYTGLILANQGAPDSGVLHKGRIDYHRFRGCTRLPHLPHLLAFLPHSRRWGWGPPTSWG